MWPVRPAAALGVSMKLVENPYRIGRPVVQADAFVGRTRELAELRATLTEGARGVWLRGQRRIGKTSLLHRVRVEAPTWSPTDLVPVFYDPSRDQGSAELVRGLSLAIARALRIQPPTLSGESAPKSGVSAA